MARQKYTKSEIREFSEVSCNEGGLYCLFFSVLTGLDVQHAHRLTKTAYGSDLVNAWSDVVTRDMSIVVRTRRSGIGERAVKKDFSPHSDSCSLRISDNSKLSPKYYILEYTL